MRVLGDQELRLDDELGQPGLGDYRLYGARFDAGGGRRRVLSSSVIGSVVARVAATTVSALLFSRFDDLVGRQFGSNCLGPLGRPPPSILSAAESIAVPMDLEQDSRAVIPLATTSNGRRYFRTEHK